MRTLVAAMVLLSTALGCNRHKGTVMLYEGAPLIVYQTRAVYKNLVPVGLNEDKTEIVSYPHPSDLRYDEENFRFPVALGKGFLLDNQGIGPNVAFLDMTYEEYGLLEYVPELETLYSRIKDKDPLIQMYRAGYAGEFEDPVSEIKRWIRNDSLMVKAVRLR